MFYTEQKDLDILGLGARWGCAFVGPINALENVLKRPLKESEIDEVIGRAFRYGMAEMCNYIDHKNTKKQAKDCTSWDDKDNPEWHYLVKKRRYFIAYLNDRFGVAIPVNDFKIAIMRTQFGGLHYCLKTASGELINPDSYLKGPIIEERPLVY